MRILITGAAGRLAAIVAPAARAAGHDVVLVDRLSGDLAGDRIHVVDLGDQAAMQPLLAGIDVVVHLGGMSTEAPYDDIRRSNLDGAYSLYECARIAHVPRVLFASSHHAIGFYPAGEAIGLDAPARPDTLYAASKLFGEALARLYWDKYGVESAVLRIGSVQPRPIDRRMLSTWISEADFTALIVRLLAMPELGFRLLYAVSDNADRWWPLPEIDGWSPRDRAQEAADPGLSDAATERLQGGHFTRLQAFDAQPDTASRDGP